MKAILSEGILEYFEVTYIQEHPDNHDIFLEEKDFHRKENKRQRLISNSFFEPISVLIPHAEQAFERATQDLVKWFLFRGPAWVCNELDPVSRKSEKRSSVMDKTFFSNENYTVIINKEAKRRKNLGFHSQRGYL